MSLLCILSKVLEKLIYNSIFDSYLSINLALSRAGLRSLQQLLAYFNDIIIMVAIEIYIMVAIVVWL